MKTPGRSRKKNRNGQCGYFWVFFCHVDVNNRICRSNPQHPERGTAETINTETGDTMSVCVHSDIGVIAWRAQRERGAPGKCPNLGMFLNEITQDYE